MKTKSLVSWSKLVKILIVISFMLILSITVIMTEASGEQLTVPDEFSLIISRGSVELYRDNPTRSKFIQLVDLSKGASVELRHGIVNNQGIGNGPFGGNNPSIWRQTLQETWSDFSGSNDKAFCITNGQFFSTNDDPTTLAFSLKVDDEYFSDGYAVDGPREEFPSPGEPGPNQKLMLEIWDDKVDIKELTEDNYYSSGAPDIIGGLSEFAPKPPSTTARTFVGIDDANGDGIYETILILNSLNSTQAEAADDLRSFGTDPNKVKVMMLDGGSSTQLICEDQPYVTSSRTIPQTLAVSSGKNATGTAQYGMRWLESAAVGWQNSHYCIGCHVQPKAIQAAAIAKDNGFTIDNTSLATLMNFMKSRQTYWGDFGGWPIGEEHHAAPGFAAYDRSISNDSQSNVISLANWFLTRQASDGRWAIDRYEAPVDQGDFLVTANAITILAQAYNRTGDPRFSTSMQLGAHWLASHIGNTVTTQDKTHIIIGLVASGRSLNDPAIQEMINQLRSEQRADGGWSDTAGGSSTAFGTGQVLYAFRLAGVRLDDPAVTTGVNWLIDNQESEGSWPLTDNADPHRRSKYSPTMWGVLGLVQSVDLTPPTIVPTVLPVYVPKWISLAIDIFDNVAGSGINPASIVAKLDDVVVPNFYIPALNKVIVFVDPLETHTITVDASDNQGNKAQQLVIDFTVDTTLLGIETISPNNGAINIPIDSNFMATFNAAIDETTINDTTAILSDENNNPIPRIISFDSNTNIINIQPTEPLEYQTYYVLTIRGGDSGVRDIEGLPMVMDFQFGFRTRSASGDVTPPSVTDISLQDDGTIIVLFSESMDPFTINGSTILLKEQNTGINVPRAVSYDSSTMAALVFPLDPLDTSKVYEVHVLGGLGGVTDLASNPMEFDHVVSLGNSPPIADAGGPYTGNEGESISLDASSSSDPDGEIILYEWDLDNDGEYDDAAGVISEVTYGDDGTYFVGLTVTDEHGDSDTDVAEIAINNVNPLVEIDLLTQTVQYSDYIANVTISATDVTEDELTATTSWSVDGGAFNPGSLPPGLSLSSVSCSSYAGTQICTWVLSGTTDVPEGEYTVRVTIDDSDGGVVDTDITVTVISEDAMVTFDKDNPVSEKVDEPLSDSSLPFSLTAYVSEKQPDYPERSSQPGDINNADVYMRLESVGSGGPVYPVSLCSQSVNGSGYDGEITLTCDFEGVPVNTYSVIVDIEGGYYKPQGEDVFTVYDPSLGFTTGGGWFYWPETEEKTNFGYTMKYNNKGEKVKGSLLLVRHLADGTIYRVKSNALDGLALGQSIDPLYGWASFTGKATYKDPAYPEYPDPVGNHSFVVYVEDWDEPGTGVDQFWIEVIDRDGIRIPVMSMDRDAAENTVDLHGGNIVVPH